MSDFINNVITVMRYATLHHESIRGRDESYLCFWTSRTGSFSIHWMPGVKDLEFRHCDRRIYLTEAEESMLALWVRDRYDADRDSSEDQFCAAVAEFKKENADG